MVDLVLKIVQFSKNYDYKIDHKSKTNNWKYIFHSDQNIAQQFRQKNKTAPFQGGSLHYVNVEITLLDTWLSGITG